MSFTSTTDLVAPLQREERVEPVTRHYRPDSADVEELVEVLYQLLGDLPAGDSGVVSEPAESTCFPEAHE